MNVLLTGGSGFIGTAILKRLASQPNCKLRVTMRQVKDQLPDQVDVIHVTDLISNTDWSAALQGVDIVIHAAAHAHVSTEKSSDSLNEFREVNVVGTLRLAQGAVSSGVKRFIFLSSIGVNGNWNDVPFTEDNIYNPAEPYAVSKMEAEQGLRQLADETGLEVVIIRPPLVYGLNAPGNFRWLLRAVEKGIPLPLGSIYNQRSFVGLDNLVDFIVTCIEHPAAENQTFLVADGEDLSTTELLQRLAKAMNKPARLIPVPLKTLELVVGLFGRQAIIQRLCGNLQIDISKARELLSWEPPVSVDDGLKRCVAGQNQTIGDSSILRFFDIIFSAVGLICGFPILLLLAIIGLFDTGSPIFCQERIGKKQQPFILVKFRTMQLNTDSVASHLASVSSITTFGHFLRRTKLDELPQLWNVLKGEMSLVGPRPCLFNQEELIEERASRGIFNARPGVTGLAQVNDIDMSTPRLLAETDQRMLKSLSLKDYFRYIFMTIAGKGSGDRVKKR